MVRHSGKVTAHPAPSYPWSTPGGGLHRRSAATPAAVRRWSLLLFLSLLPMLSAIDHLDISFDIPGTNSYFSLQPPGETHGHGHSHAPAAEADAAHNHAEHCHINAASCGDQPAPSTTGFALLDESARMLGAAAIFVLIAAAAMLIPSGRSITPMPPPPR